MPLPVNVRCQCISHSLFSRWIALLAVTSNHPRRQAWYLFDGILDHTRSMEVRAGRRLWSHRAILWTHIKKSSQDLLKGPLNELHDLCTAINLSTVRDVCRMSIRFSKFIMFNTWDTYLLDPIFFKPLTFVSVYYSDKSWLDQGCLYINKAAMRTHGNTSKSFTAAIAGVLVAVIDWVTKKHPTRSIPNLQQA